MGNRNLPKLSPGGTAIGVAIILLVIFAVAGRILVGLAMEEKVSESIGMIGILLIVSSPVSALMGFGAVTLLSKKNRDHFYGNKES